MRVRRALVVSALLLATLTGPRAESLPEPTEVIHRVRRAASAIELDGALVESAWKAALSLDLNYEVQPGENVAPPVRTTCLVTYDERYVYFGFKAYDPDPSRIRARFSDRDRAWDDDWVGVVLDTFNDQRRAYELFSTPLGVQTDAVNDDVGGNYDSSWNAIWKSAGRITEHGYEVEMAIPFNQIRFQQSDGEQTWGFDAIRSYPRGHRHHIGVFPRDRGNNSYLSQTIKLVGMKGASPGQNLEVIPTLTGSRIDTRDSLPDGDLRTGDTDTELGVSVRWGITPNTSLNGALNPDFSQVEADALQLNVNEQFALFFRETRPFFLEGADYFNSNLNLVHTRTIADPSAAGKLTGKDGRHTWGVFSARDDRTDILVPGPEGSSADSFSTASTSTVGRYRYDFGSNSTVGGTVTDRRGAGYSNTVMSADSVYRISDADSVRLSFAFSDTEYNDEMAMALTLTDRTVRDHAARVQFDHSERDWWVHARYEEFGEDFRADTGFQPRVDYRSYSGSGARVFWGEEGSFFNRRAWGASAFHREQQNGTLLDENVRTWFNFQGPRQSRMSFDARLSRRGFSGVEFELFEAGISGNVQATADLSLGIRVNVGEWIDFDHVRPADQLFVRPSLSYKFGRHLSLSYSHIYRTLDVEDGRLFRIHAPELRLIHQFNTRAYVRLIAQYVDVQRDPSLYSETVDAQSRSLLSQFLFTYKLNPQTALYVGYTDDRQATDAYDLVLGERSFFMKLGYAWLR